MTQPKGLIKHIDERCYEAYKNGMNEDEISEKVGIPVISVREAIRRKIIKENRENI
ncbi:hypothetical protein [Mammaliicoccus sp. G-M31]|uniref:hypothetical protein n=1 Tax=Mammaliicoccus sp. G-M31 TaxID=2898690 RepID=UPI001EFBCC27|nr:hypothetical protein [Mammaliicoccus sp. G-M31]